MSILFQTIIDAGKQMRNGFVSFIAHVGETECFAAKFAVAGIDDDVMFFPKFSFAKALKAESCYGPTTMEKSTP